MWHRPGCGAASSRCGAGSAAGANVMAGDSGVDVMDGESEDRSRAGRAQAGSAAHRAGRAQGRSGRAVAAAARPGTWNKRVAEAQQTLPFPISQYSPKYLKCTASENDRITPYINA